MKERQTYWTVFSSFYLAPYLQDNCFIRWNRWFHALEPIVSLYETRSFMPLKLKFHTVGTRVSRPWNFGFAPMKLWFRTDETLVSYRWNSGIKARKPTLLATVTAEILSHCYHTVPSPQNLHILSLLPLFMWQMTANIYFYFKCREYILLPQ